MSVMSCQKVCKQGRDDNESKGQCIGKVPSLYIFFTLQLPSIVLLPTYYLLIICVWFCSCLCKVCSHVSEALTLFADYVYN